jgi:DNA-binding transcriptional ArsR family regulator
MVMMHQQTHQMQPSQLDAVFGALADPTRRAILARLAEGDANVLQLAAPFKVSQPAISRHLKVLERAGLISRSRRATTRLSHLQAEPLREATAWLARYQAFWDESHQRLDQLLAQLQVDRARLAPSAGAPNQEQTHQARTTAPQPEETR